MLGELAICQSKAAGCQGLKDLAQVREPMGPEAFGWMGFVDAMLTRKAPKRRYFSVRTVNRHRWSRRAASGARVKPLQGTRQIGPVTSEEGVPEGC